MTGADERVVSDDFFQGDVRAGIERVRRRLLDLTNRNRLLNFRYPRRSRSVLRIVDELPDQLCESLLGGAELVFDPVRRPTKPEFELWRDERLARLKSKYGERFDDSVDLRAEALAEPSVEEFARRLGIETSYELPTAADQSVALIRHQDELIQTLLFPSDLERTLYSIQNKARLAIEETGTNMLYLALGFLEWYESDASEQSHLAPLFLLPVDLAKGRFDEASNVYRYTVSYSGEDLVANVSLQEKLRVDFGLGLPELNEDELPEAYWTRVHAVVSRRPRWKVRRHATLCLLSFGKLLMYRDLDPDRWPGQGIDGHPRLRDFFVGVERGDDVAAEEYRIDDLPDAPGLIDDADSSQHSALVDALRGKNLVIEGPPGTGKSQTITNLIAASLAEGKTVLFASEKLAALEVVKKRLTEANLGLFCLELHSHKTRKKEFLNELEQRLALRGSFAAPDEYDALERQLRDRRDLLNRYAELVEQPVGKLETTVHDVLWAARLRARALGDLRERIKDVTEPAAAEIDRLDLANETRALQALGDALKTVLEKFGSFADHPWVPVTRHELTFLDRAQVVSAVRRLGEKSVAVELDHGSTLRALHVFLDAVSGVEACPDGVPPEVLVGLRGPVGQAAAENLLGRLRSYLKAERKVLELVPVAARDPDEWSKRLGRAMNMLRLCGEPESQLGHTLEKVAGLQPHAQRLSEVRNLPEVLRASLGCSLNQNVEDARVATVLRDTLQRIPTEYMYLRSGMPCDPSALPIVEKLKGQQADMMDEQHQLAQHFDFDSMPNVETIRGDVATLASAGPLWWFRGKIRQARRRFMAAARTEGKRSPREMVQWLRRIAGFLERRQAFERHPGLAEVAGTHLAGLETPLTGMAAVLEWHRDAELAIAGAASLQHALVSVVRTVESRALEVLANQTESYCSSDLLDESLFTASQVLGREIEAPTDIGALALDLQGVAARAADAIEDLVELAVPNVWTVAQVQDAQAAVEELASAVAEIHADEPGRSAAGELFAGVKTDCGGLESALTYARSISDLTLPREILDCVLSGENREEVVRLHDTARRLTVQVDAFRGAAAELDGLTKMAWDKLAGSPTLLEDAEITAVAAWCERALSNEAAFEDWTNLLNARRVLKQASAGHLADLAIKQQLSADQLVMAFEFTLYETLARRAFSEHPELVQFQGLDHDRVRSEYQRLDQLLMSAYRGRVAAVLDGRPVPVGSGTGPVKTYTELSLIEHEISKQRRHVSIRQLVRRAGRALQALKPCFMMGPLSVAQYLEPGRLEFDVVVMDEASQIKPEDALGAIARGVQLVIVGDSKQLPPTSFFERMDDYEEEEDDLAEGVLEAESILDVASSAYRPTRMLRWHYRSRHQSLIHFSNTSFYNGSLIVFPSATVHSQKLGVKFHRIRGRYEARRNLPEVAAVVEFLLDHMRTRPDESIGVATMNTTQRDVIQDAFEERIKSEPAAQAFLGIWREGLEPFFIKNLESVQGDERDVILVSVTFGPDARNRIDQRSFGPLTRPTGYRRLNVLVTRAKNRVEIFSSMSADDIRVNADSHAGVVALKDYLRYAETGVLQQVQITGKEPDSDFELEVATALSLRGLECVAQVGVAGYFVDLAIRDPRVLGRFILGVECDGATYHSGRSARDRDRLRQQVLEDMGWTIHRVWSTDWFRDPHRETERIVAAVIDLQERYPVTSQDYADVPDAVPAGAGDSVPSELEEPATVREPEWMSPEAARDELLAIKQRVLDETFPAVPQTESILREEMLEALLRERPTTREEWLRTIPLELRLQTAPEHMVVLEDILHVLSRTR